MTKINDLHIENLQDGWSKLYVYLARNITDDLGFDGEIILRQGSRGYGTDRAVALRKKHMEYGLKPHLYNMFTYGDLPTDPRFRRNRIKLTPQERLSETLVCPIADVWIEMGAKKLGRIFCEEVHHCQYGKYAPAMQVNLTNTITQEGDDFCRFSLYLRPGNMDADGRKETFEEFDPDYKPPTKEYPLTSPRDGFEKLAILLYYNITAAAISQVGEKVKQTIVNATEQYANDLGNFMRAKAEAFGEPLNDDFLEKSSIIELKRGTNYASIWSSYENKEPQQIFESAFFPIYQKLLGVK